MIDILKEGLWGSLNSVYTMAIIVIPIMVVLQIARDYKILNKLTYYFRFITKILGISTPSVFPLLVGLFFGISFGAGVIIDSHREGNITKRDGVLLMLFLSACHGIVEDTLIFAVIGANAYLLLSLRLTAAVTLTHYISRYMNRTELSSVKNNM